MSEKPHDLTTMHVGRALAGDDASKEWLVDRFTPLLLAQARHRLAKNLSGTVDAEDLVQDVWMIALPKLSAIRPRGGRATPVLIRYLGSVLQNRYGTLLQKHVFNKPGRAQTTSSMDPIDVLDDKDLNVVQAVIKRERGGRLLQTIEALPDTDRRVVLLRGIEQATNAEAATILGIPLNSVSVRYHRALKKLRQQLPGTVFDDFDES